MAAGGDDEFQGREGAKAAKLIMETNSSSVVSKRSVERLYYPEPHFFRHFVKKPQRRSPLINRGYWLRMQAVDCVVHRFVEQPSKKPKVVMNLGCGYDPLPFRMLSQHPRHCQNVTFVDVDYKKLMLTKRDIICQTSALKNLRCGIRATSKHKAALLRSDRYLAIGCDLQNLEVLEEALKAELDISEYLILCIAEVSITYMDPVAADALIAWASKLGDGVHFCLLEQFLPDGPDHPFAKQMMKHFEKLRTPLRSLLVYPSLQDQRKRFIRAGWQVPHIRSLWSLWSDSNFLSPSQRMSLDNIEPFDEWEEFALFASHYFLLITSSKNDTQSLLIATSKNTQSRMSDGSEQHSTPRTGPVSDIGSESQYQRELPIFNMDFQQNHGPRGRRRYAAVIEQPTAGAVGVHGGHGLQTRLASTDVYALSSTEVKDSDHPPFNIPARMCHTVTSMKGNQCLLVGGRASPAAAMGDCWHKKDGVWSQTESLPAPRYRQGATPVACKDGQTKVLIFGGKDGPSRVLTDWCIWDARTGWQILPVIDKAPVPRFGALLASLTEDTGIIFGGMRQDGVVYKDFWIWRLVWSGNEIRGINCELFTVNSKPVPSSREWPGRFGATLTPTKWGLTIAGGVSGDGCLLRRDEIMVLDTKTILEYIRAHGLKAIRRVEFPVLSHLDFDNPNDAPRPLLIGHSTSAARPGKVQILGGGAVCFSFGTYWNEGNWTLRDAADISTDNWVLKEPSSSAYQPQTQRDRAGLSDKSHPSIPKVRIDYPSDFTRIVDKAQPVVLEGLDIGPCCQLWTKEYLRDAIGVCRQVVVHEARSPRMDFARKNFVYVTKDFGAFLDQIHEGQHQYLRSVSSDSPTEMPANLYCDFPGIASDFRLPPELCLVSKNAHSSPLRISGPVSVWLHYDVMANVLCQIRGTKRLILYPPSDVSHLHLSPGASSSSIDVFPDGPSTCPFLPNTHPHEAVLTPGDVLFIPPLWLHAASPTDTVSIAVNVFFRNLPQGYAAGRDVYGNRDLQAYEKGRRDIEKIAKAFQGLSPDMARFYLERLGDELKSKAVNP